MKAPQYRSNEKELLGEKVVVKYNEDGDGMSNPSSLIETIPEHHYLTRKKVRYTTRKNVKIPSKCSSEPSDIADVAKSKNGENEELGDQGRYNFELKFGCFELRLLLSKFETNNIYVDHSRSNG